MAMKSDQERVKHLLTDTVTLLCRNGLQFRKQLKVQGLLGITLDDNEVFLIQIDETLGSLQPTVNNANSSAISNEIERINISTHQQGQRTVTNHSKESSKGKVASRLLRPLSRYRGALNALHRKRLQQQWHKYGGKVARNENALGSASNALQNSDVQVEDDVIIIDHKPDIDKPVDRKLMQGAYLAEVSASEHQTHQNFHCFRLTLV